MSDKRLNGIDYDLSISSRVFMNIYDTVDDVPIIIADDTVYEVNSYLFVNPYYCTSR